MRILQNPYENMVQWLTQLSLRVLTYQKIQRGIVEMVRSSATKSFTLPKNRMIYKLTL